MNSTLIKQEAHGPRLAHLSEIAIADVRMLCNIFPILSLQLMRGSSFEQFLILQKKERLYYYFSFYHIFSTWYLD